MPCNTSIIFGQDRKSLDMLLQKCLNDLDDFSFKQAVLHVVTTYKPELLRQPQEKTSGSAVYKEEVYSYASYFN
jgi:hypothetical protein